jgi:V8-like Glu-specific endopeptidase
VLVLLAFNAAALVGVLVVPISAGADAPVPDSVPTVGLPAVGALFLTAKVGALGPHFCTAGVVDSPAGDLVLTAAHCINGLSPGEFVFLPGYHHGQAPFGVWTVTKVDVDHAWARSGDPDDDFAFLVVRQARTRVTVQERTGGEQLGIDPVPGQVLKVVGYPDAASSPISCRNTVLLFSQTQLQFDCSGYTDGTSGSPMVADVNPATGLGKVVGVIGGYELGGYTPSVSYAARFGENMATLYRAAIAGSPGE